MKVVGWIGSMMLALCGLPQAIQSIQLGHSFGINPWFLGLWGGGEILLLVYVIYRHKADAPLITNYILNLTFIGIIAWYL